MDKETEASVLDNVPQVSQLASFESGIRFKSSKTCTCNSYYFPGHRNKEKVNPKARILILDDTLL